MTQGWGDELEEDEGNPFEVEDDDLLLGRMYAE